MKLIEKVGELKELEKKASAESLPGPQANSTRFCLKIHNAAPCMLAVLGQFREGDAEKMQFAIGWLETTNIHSSVFEMLNRLQEAARLMEAECEK